MTLVHIIERVYGRRRFLFRKKNGLFELQWHKLRAGPVREGSAGLFLQIDIQYDQRAESQARQAVGGKKCQVDPAEVIRPYQ